MTSGKVKEIIRLYVALWGSSAESDVGKGFSKLVLWTKKISVEKVFVTRGPMCIPSVWHTGSRSVWSLVSTDLVGWRDVYVVKVGSQSPSHHVTTRPIRNYVELTYTDFGRESMTISGSDLSVEHLLFPKSTSTPQPMSYFPSQPRPHCRRLKVSSHQLRHRWFTQGEPVLSRPNLFRLSVTSRVRGYSLNFFVIEFLRWR